MRKFPVLFVYPFGPTPETTLPDGCRFIYRKILVQVKAVSADLIDHEFHLMLVTQNRFASIDFSRKVCGGNLSLPHRHVAHLRSAEVHAVADCIYLLVAGNTHC